ncbi:MAG: ATP-dependent DNA helicase RecG [Clostridiales bacterium]|nr:ATP-dependent DNA helicase RecG [Clostridiales bacterium]
MTSLNLLGLRKDKVEQFNKKGIYNIQDLVDFIPRKYYDFTKPKLIKELENDSFDAVIGIITEIQNKNGIIIIKLKDDLNSKMNITFFNQAYLQKKFKVNDKVIVCGKVKYLENYNNFRTMTNPLIISKDIEGNKRVYPVYSSISGMSQDFLEKSILAALNLSDKDDYLENTLLSKYDLIPKYKANIKFHRPTNMKDIELAKKRLLFDDLFFFNYELSKQNNKVHDSSNIEIKKFDKCKELINKLPFELTEGQRLVLRNLCKKIKNKKTLNALVQGDVGVGKTLVAILLMLTVTENGYQSCLVAPTNILAKQHYMELKELVEPLGFKVGFISGELKKRELKAILKDLEDGLIDMVVGTHSLFGDDVKFKNLGIAIIDEEHRFGVKQRDKMKLENVHRVSMSATPIPRSLALAMYGDTIDVETIRTQPAGRKEVETNIVNIDKKNIVYDKILKELEKGKQAYIVCPLINKSENEKFENIINLKDEFENSKKFFEKHGFKVGVVNGKMKEDEISNEIQNFKNKEYHVLVSTSIIEVGVNVPNATVMVINNAERFGFSQLHQLRGRVGRGSDKSYCYLVTDNTEKFDIFTKTRDGFEIAKEDLKLRGAGDFIGTAQSGNNKYLMLMLSNPELNQSIKEDVNLILKEEKRFKRYNLFLKSKEEEIESK